MRHIIAIQTVHLSSCALVYAFWSAGIVEKAITKNKRVVFYTARGNHWSDYGKSEDALYTRYN